MNSDESLTAQSANPVSADVCAIVITFRPGPEVLLNLREVKAQVGRLIVVDNGSPPERLVFLRAAADALRFHLIENGRNLGIAAALNIGVRQALSRGCRWVLLLDQDSCITPGFVAQMVCDFDIQNASRRIMLLVPRYRDAQSGAESTLLLDQDGGPLVTMTSGSLLPVEAFAQCGPFAEELFIYTVDDEYSLRLRTRGFSIAQSKSAILLHSAGAPTVHRFLGATIRTTNHSPGARYYLNRNRIWMLRIYGRMYPRWVRAIARAFILELMKVLLAEKSRWLKIKMIFLGIWDGVLGRMGERVAL